MDGYRFSKEKKTLFLFLSLSSLQMRSKIRETLHDRKDCFFLLLFLIDHFLPLFRQFLLKMGNSLFSSFQQLMVNVFIINFCQRLNSILLQSIKYEKLKLLCKRPLYLHNIYSLFCQYFYWLLLLSFPIQFIPLTSFGVDYITFAHTAHTQNYLDTSFSMMFTYIAYPI